MFRVTNTKENTHLLTRHHQRAHWIQTLNQKLIPNTEIDRPLEANKGRIYGERQFPSHIKKALSRKFSTLTCSTKGDYVTTIIIQTHDNKHTKTAISDSSI